MTALAVLLAPLMVGSIADATSLRAPLAVVPGLLALAAAGLMVVRRQARRLDTVAELRPADLPRG